MTEPEEVCRYCGGTGKVLAKPAGMFPVGTPVWWNAGGSGPWKRLAGVVKRHSRSGEKIRISYRAPQWNGTLTYSDVFPKSLEFRMTEPRDG